MWITAETTEFEQVYNYKKLFLFKKKLCPFNLFFGFRVYYSIMFKTATCSLVAILFLKKSMSKISYAT